MRRLHTKDDFRAWDDVTFQFGPQAFLYAGRKSIAGFASSPVESERLVADFAKKYRRPTSGSFRLIGQEGSWFNCVTVALGANPVLNRKQFDLHYGPRAWEWHEEFLGKLRTCHSGLSILEGPPGTGKTSYVRHIMGSLQESHRFYFLPASEMGALSQPSFTDFWAANRRYHKEPNFVLIVDIPDAAPLSHGSGKQDHINAILNLSQGMLGDFLRLHVICTINSAVGSFDAALLRHERLLCHRVFGRLDHSTAVRLADKLGRTLPRARDYSLAEVYAAHGTHELNPRRIDLAV